MFNTQSHSWLKKSVVLFMTFVMILAYLPADAFAASGDFGTHAYFRNGSVLVGSDGKNYYNDSRAYTNRWYTTQWNEEVTHAQPGPRHAYTLKSKSSGKSYRGYCLEQDVKNPDSGNVLYTASNLEDIQFLKQLTPGRKTGIEFALLYGSQPDTGENDMVKILGDSVNGCNKDDWYVATQAIIWEFQQSLRSSVDGIPSEANIKAGKIGTTAYKKTAPDFFYAPIKNRPAGKVYRAMLNAMREYKIIPSFTSKNEKNSPTIVVEKVGNIYKAVNQNYANKTDAEKEKLREKEDYYVLNDKNKVINEIKVVNDKDFVIKHVAEGKYTLTFKGTVDDKKVYHGKKDIREATKIDCMAWNVTGGHYQTLAFGASNSMDFYFKLTEKEIPTEEKEGKEKPKPEIFPTVKFPVHKDDVNPGWDGDKCTGMGDAPLDSTFVLKRDGVEVDRITLDIYGNTDYLFDRPWMEPDDIPSKDSGTRIHMLPGDPPAKHCTVTPTRCDWDDEVTYTIEEIILPSGRHPVEFETTNNLAGNTRVRGTYKVTYHCETEDERECMDDPEYWSDMTYKIDFTDVDGTVTTFSGKVGENGLEPEMEFEYQQQIWINDNYRGDLQIVKTKDDQNPFTDKTNSDNGVKDYSTKSKWTIQLKSGGFEDHPFIRVVDEGVKTAAAGEYKRYAHVYRVVRDTSGYTADTMHPLEVSEDGQIYVYDLPYGTYEVKEIAADSTGYVLETFEIVVDTHGQKISKDVNNQPKKNVIKVVKTNQETGKTVRWDADKTAFRIRYMGNPDYANPKDSPSYGKLLPNGYGYTDKDKDYVFYANKNGEIVLPYQLEWGMYQIEELVVPNGYFVGKYDNKGNGTIADMGEVNIIDHKGQAVKPPMDFLSAVQVRDKDGKPIDKFTTSEDSNGNILTYNIYKFNVLEQDDHEDGQDYVTYYAAIEMPNIPAKGKIEITKDGEALAGWTESKESGLSIWRAIWDKIKQANTQYEIYAAKDIKHSDGVVPIKAYDSITDEEIAFEKVSRDHADIDGAKEVWEKTIDSGEKIIQTSAKQHDDANLDDPGSSPLYLLNKTITQYIIGALNGATYTQEFSVPDPEHKMTCHYTVTYKLNYSKGGFNYTDVHVTKKSTADDYVDEISPITAPVLKSGDLELGFVTMNYDNGNMVRMNRLDEEKDADEEDVTGQHSAYNTDDLDAVRIVDPKEYETNPTEGEPLEIVRPAGWTDYTKNSEGEDITNAFMVSKDGKYKIFVFDKDRNQKRWIPCTEDQKYYRSYFQEYSFTTAQHFNSGEGFTFNWDDVMKMTSALNREENETTTVIEGFAGINPVITASNVYTHETEDNITLFTGKPEDKAPVYFKTHDGIKTEMYLSGRLTHTRLTVLQSQLFVFDKTFPMITLNDEELKWNIDIDPDHSHYEYIVNDRNYIKADRHEVGPKNKEAYYTIDIVSDNTDAARGFKIIYPDTTTAAPIVTEHGEDAELIFESIDDTMVYPIGHPVQIIKTGLDGKATSKELPLGEYWVREISSNNGHVNAGQWKKFILDDKDQYTPLVWDAAQYDNDAVTVKIDLEKVFETAYESKEYKPGDGAVFGVFTAEDIKAFEGTHKDVQVKDLPIDSLVETLTVKDGHAASSVKLPLGKYYIKEISAPLGYKLNGTKYYFDAVDILTADDMKFHYKDLGVSGFLTQDGKEGVTIDFDTLYKFSAAKVNIDGKDYRMDTNYTEEGSNVSVVVNDGRTNTQVRVKDGNQTIIKFENGSSITIKASGQAYSAVLDGPAPESLEIGAEGNENFTKDVQGTKTIINYNPKVTKTNWLSEVSYKYKAPEGDKPETKDGWTAIQPANRLLELTSPEGTSSVKASIDYEYGAAELTFTKGTVTGAVIDGEEAADLSSMTLKRIERNADEEVVKDTYAVIHFADGVSFTVQFDKTGNFYMTAAGQMDRNLEAESVLTVDGSQELPKNINLKNTTAKTYARNNTGAGVLNIVVKSVKNDKLPDNPQPEEPKPEIPITPPDPNPKNPKIGTSASHIATGLIRDIVSYRDLTPGKVYTLKGILMDQASGKEIAVTAEKIFTADKQDGSISLDFGFKESDFYGKTVVVFESLYLDGKLIAYHKDLNDKKQTVTIDAPKPEEPTPDKPKEPKPQKPVVPNPSKPIVNPDVPATGDFNSWALYFIVTLISLGAITFFVALERKKSKTKQNSLKH